MKTHVFSVEDKWGLRNIETGNILIEPVWDILKKAKDHLIFCADNEMCEKYIGLDDRLEAMLKGTEPVATYNTTERWGVLNIAGDVIVDLKLDYEPEYIKPEARESKKPLLFRYYLLERKPGYGVLCSDGRLISDTVLYKKDAMFIIQGRYNEQ